MTPLLDMPFEQAATLKYEMGKAEHRPDGGDFVGDPLIELYSECLDSWNYLKDYERKGNKVPMKRFESITETVQWIKAEMENKL